MKWFTPTWNGDLRLEPDPKDDKKTILSIVKPTEHEKKTLAALAVAFGSRKWIDDETAMLELWKLWQRKTVVINASIEDVGPVIAAITRPGPGTLTAVKFKDGHIVTCEKHVAGEAQTPYREPAPAPLEPPAVPAPPEPSEELKALAKAPDAVAAATVARPTPCCPDCYIDSCAPATEVLLSFLTEAQHETWAKERYLIVQGGLSGHRYLLAHRHSRIAAKNTRICFDLDDHLVIHFHDNTVPPEEEVLAAMLILEHKEPWLRNEATCFGGECVFKNPFGDMMDGAADSGFTHTLGNMLATATGTPVDDSHYPLNVAYNPNPPAN